MTKMSASDATLYPGNPNHPEHERYLFELGRATYAAASLVGTCISILRFHDRVSHDEMYAQELGPLQELLKGLLSRAPDLPGLAAFIDELQSARKMRNDLLHAIPFYDGLYRPQSRRSPLARSFVTVEDVRFVTAQLTAAHLTGYRVLYHDDGEAIRRWYKAH